MLISPQGDKQIASGSSTTIMASATDSSGFVTAVQFFIDDVLVGEDTEAPYEFAWGQPAPGNYLLKAVATDNLTATGESSLASVTIIENLAAVVEGVSPMDGAVVSSTDTTLEVSLSDFENDELTVTFYGREAPPEPG